MLESLEGKRGVVRGQAAVARRRRSVRPADHRQQRADARERPSDPGGGAGAYRPGRRPVARHAGVPARGQRRARRHRRDAVRASRSASWSRTSVAAPDRGRPGAGRQVGGPLGAYLPTSAFDLAMDYEAFAAADGLLGHGGVVVFDDTVDLARQARFAMEFCAEESCGKCTPCRIGAGTRRRGHRPDPGRTGDHDENLVLLEELCEVMADGSLCAMGGLTPHAGAQRGPALRRRLRAGRPDGRPVAWVTLMTSILREPDLGHEGSHPATPTSPSRWTGKPVAVPGGHLRDARRRARRHRRPEAVRDRSPRRVRLVPRLPGRDRGAEGHARLVHDAGRARHAGDAPSRRASTGCGAGVMELYISDHPPTASPAPPTSECEVHRTSPAGRAARGPVRLRRVRRIST